MKRRRRALNPAAHRALLGIGLIILIILLALAVASQRARGQQVSPENDPERAREWKTAEFPHGDFKEDCEQCHRTDTWVPAEIQESFDHSRYGLELSGAHSDTYCGFCHSSLVFSEVPTECGDCHEDVHRGELGFDCGRCHGTRTFIDRGDQLRLHRLSRFALSGAHTTLDCDRCHPPSAQGQLSFVNTNVECEGCHRADYEATRQPDHVGGNFSLECELCHGTSAWRGAVFDHATTGFPLTGAHRPLDCTNCHLGGDFGGLNPACAACHQDDYDATTDPDHLGSGFDLECEICHNTTTWEGAVFDHDGRFFPIYSGTHREEWVECIECHTTPSNFSSFSCIDCHPHSDEIETNNKHSEVEGEYLYESFACLDCHPQGRH